MMDAANAARRYVAGIVGPSGYAEAGTDLARAAARLDTLGFDVRYFTPAGAPWQRFAADDATRSAGLHDAARDPEVDVVMALRGGYGASRLLEQIDFAMLAKSGKLFVGHSDFTAIQMGLLTHGGMSFAGPMLCSDFAREDTVDYTLSSFVDCLRGPRHVVTLAAAGQPAVDAHGTLWGGNLAMLAHLVGSPWMPAIDGGILFVEDINEHPFRIERMLLQLLHAGVLARQSALVFGDFSGAHTGVYDNGYDFSAMLEFLRCRLTIPILTGLPFGHVPVKTTLAVGSHAHLEGEGDTVTLVMDHYPTLR